MSRFPRAALILAVGLAGCAKVHFTTWRGPVLPTQPYKKILVCVAPKDAPSAREIERAVAHALSPYPVAAAACLDVFSVSKPASAAAMNGMIRDGGYGAVLVVERESIIQWSSASAAGEKGLPAFLRVYTSGVRGDKSPVKLGVVVSHQEGGPWRHVRGNFRLFDVTTGELAWKSQGGAKAPNAFSIERFATDVAARNFEALAKEGLIPPAPVRQ